MLPNLNDLYAQIAALFIDETSDEATRPIWFAEFHDGANRLPQEVASHHRDWLNAADFAAKPGSLALLPDNGKLAGVVAGADAPWDHGVSPLFSGSLPPIVPKGSYHLGWDTGDAELAALAWALGHYTFTRYQSGGKNGIKRLRLPEGAKLNSVANMAAAVWLARDLINTPANDLGPAELEEAARAVAAHFGAECGVIAGDDLLANNFPLIHAVGRASARAPRLIDMGWGSSNGEKITIIGKGICFDTGGLNIKPSLGMALMKKDMGGAATALALAAMIMSANLPVRLRVLIPAAENSISGDSFRPGDVVKSRAGLNVEVGDTDAEGRLVLADALALADEDAPRHLISFATLTGSARIALGPDLPPVYSTDAVLANRLADIGKAIGDPMWPMPLWQPYDQLLDSRVGDVNSIFPEPFAGSIMAALFLKRFVNAAKTYTHFDIYG